MENNLVVYALFCIPVGLLSPVNLEFICNSADVLFMQVAKNLLAFGCTACDSIFDHVGIKQSLPTLRPLRSDLRDR